MKVLQILPELNAGGVERTTLEIAQALNVSGFQPHVCSNGGRMQAGFSAYNTVHHTFNIGSKNPLHLRRNTQALIDIIKAHEIDLVHARSRAPAWPAHAAAKATGKPFVTTYHGIYNAKSRAKKRYNAIMAKGDIIIANSNYTKNHIQTQHGIRSENIRVIPRGVDMDLFDPARLAAEDRDRQRKVWNILDGQKIILLPGRLTRWKGQVIAIKALAHLPEEFGLILMGDDQGRTKYVEELNNLTKVLKLEERVHLPGHSAEVAQALFASDIIIAPSIEPEAFGRVVAEAQAMGRPVIASAHGGPIETVVSGKTGLLCEVNNPPALAKAIETILTWKNYEPSFARAHVAKNFSKTQLQRKTLDVYRHLLAQ